MRNLGTSIARAAVLAVTALDLPRVSADDHRLVRVRIARAVTGRGDRFDIGDAARAADRVISDCIALTHYSAR